MDPQELERIRVDARFIQAMLETAKHSKDSQMLFKTALEAGKRIEDSCDRLVKRVKVQTPPDEKESLDEDEEKVRLIEQSKLAGDHVLPFGQHKGKSLKEVPTSYLGWLLGVKREGREFVPVSTDRHGWILANHVDSIAQVKTFLTWRCWACKSTNTRFKFSRLCVDCWHCAF